MAVKDSFNSKKFGGQQPQKPGQQPQKPGQVPSPTSGGGSGLGGFFGGGGGGGGGGDGRFGASEGMLKHP